MRLGDTFIGATEATCGRGSASSGTLLPKCAASLRVGEATVCALAAVNPFGDVVAEDGGVLAGVWRDGAYAPTSELLRAGEGPRMPVGEATTLVTILTVVIVAAFIGVVDQLLNMLVHLLFR